MKYRITLLFALITFGPGLDASEWYAAPNATTNGNGAITNAWPLQIALTNSAIQPGDTLWLRGGTYGMGSNIFACKLTGTSNNPIVVRQYPGERAIIDGGIQDSVPNQGNGSWTTFWGFEITCTTARTNTMVGRPGGLGIGGVGQKAINMIIHDTGEACIGDMASDGTGREIYGCIIWGCGIYDTDSPYSATNAWTRGSPIYTQNHYNTMTVSDNISSRNFTTGMKAYAENGYASGYVFDGNVVFGCPAAGIEVECLNNSITNATVINNFTYHCGKTPMGYFSSDSLAQHYGLVYSNNYIVDSPGPGSATLWLKRWNDMTVLGNTIITVCQTNDWYAGSGTGSGMGGHFIELYPSTNAVLSYTINSNAYYGGVEQDADWYSWSVIDGTNWYGPFYHTYQPFRYKDNAVSPPDGTNGLLSFVAWNNSHGFDLNSTYTTNLPTTNVVVLRANKYEQGRGHIVVFNWEGLTNISVNLSSFGLTNGQTYEVRDAQDYLGTPVHSGTYQLASPTVTLSLTLTNVTAPTGDVPDNLKVHTSSLFNVFVVIKTDAGNGVLYGDVDSDGSVTAYDAALTARYAVGYTDADFKNAAAADVDNIPGISAYDAALIAQRAVGLISKFPVEN